MNDAKRGDELFLSGVGSRIEEFQEDSCRSIVSKCYAKSQALKSIVHPVCNPNASAQVLRSRCITHIYEKSSPFSSIAFLILKQIVVFHLSNLLV